MTDQGADDVTSYAADGPPAVEVVGEVSATDQPRTAARAEMDEMCREFARTGQRALRNKIVERHLGTVEPYVRRYSGRGIDAEDLRQAGLLAIVRALDRFDPEMGVAFATFAGRTVEGELKRLLRDRSWAVRPPRQRQELFLVVRRHEDELIQSLGRSPSIRELAGAIGESEENVLEALEAGDARHAKSLDRPVNDQGLTAGSFLESRDNDFTRSEVRLLVESLLEQLDQRSREVIYLRFYQDMGQPEIAERLGLSQSYVSRLIRRILGEMQEELKDVLDDQLDPSPGSGEPSSATQADPQ